MVGFDLVSLDQLSRMLLASSTIKLLYNRTHVCTKPLFKGSEPFCTVYHINGTSRMRAHWIVILQDIVNSDFMPIVCYWAIVTSVMWFISSTQGASISCTPARELDLPILCRHNMQSRNCLPQFLLCSVGGSLGAFLSVFISPCRWWCSHFLCFTLERW